MGSLRIGTRGSQLALFQARTVAARLQETTGATAEIVIIRTSGDRLAEASIPEAGGKRLFVKEIEDALLAGTVDLAVHSSKDMPVDLPPGLALAAALPRDDPRDALVLPHGRTQGTGTTPDIEALHARLGARPRIGTSSVRRSAQLARLFEDARFLPIRGNLDTRLRKLDEGGYDAIVLAAAGLRRLDQAGRISMLLPVEACVPAPGQGIIAVETRADDARTRAVVASIDDGPAAMALTAERAVVQRLGGGCQMPIGAYAAIQDTDIAVTAIVLSIDGTRALRASDRGSTARAEGVGRTVGAQLLEAGADDLLADIRRLQAATGSREP